MTLQVEIAICTWNRSKLLQCTLERFAALRCAWDQISDVDWNLIVIDNNCSDETASLLVDYQSKLPLRIGREHLQGHTHARNRAIQMASGNLLIWTDDDVVVSDNWLPTYARAAIEQPKVSFWGSKITPRFVGSSKTPEWIHQNWQLLKGCFAERDLGDSPLSFNMQQLPYGANFAVRTDVQKQFTFQTQLGRSEELVVGEDEIEMLKRLLQSGHEGNWVPDAPVEHLIDSSRQTTGYVAKYFEGQGRALVARNEAWTNDTKSLKKEANHELFWSKIKQYFSHSDVWISHLIRGSLAKGQWQALRSLSCNRQTTD